MRKIKRNYTYAEAHNRAVNTYQRCVMVIFFIALFNITGAITGCFRPEEVPQYFPSLVNNILLFRLISYLKLNFVVQSLLIVAVSVLFASLLTACWFFAKRGKKIALYLAVAYYLIDTIFIFIFWGQEPTLLVQIILHILVLMFLVFGIISYQQVLSIEKKYRTSPERKD